MFPELFLQAFYRLGDLLNARMRGMAPELMVRLLMRWTENGVTQCLMPMFPGRYFQPVAVRELPGSAQLRPGEWGQVHVTGWVTVRTGKSRLLPDGDTTMGCRDIPVGVHGRTPPTPS